MPKITSTQLQEGAEAQAAYEMQARSMQKYYVEFLATLQIANEEFCRAAVVSRSNSDAVAFMRAATIHKQTVATARRNLLVQLE